MPLKPRELASRPLHFIWICDCSGSMSINGKIESLNNAIRDVIPVMQKEASENTNAQVLMRTIEFSSGARWHTAQPKPIEEFEWINLTADGVTDMGKALSMVAEQLKMPPMTDRALPPVLVLITDGQPTDDFSSGLKKLMEQPWGKKAVRIAIAVGTDVDYEPLQKFIGNPELKPLQANSPERLVKMVKWASTVVKNVSQPKPDPGSSDGTPVPIPQPPDLIIDNNPPDDWDW